MMPELAYTTTRWSALQGHSHLAAARRIAAGEVILRETPLVKVGLGPYRYGLHPWELTAILVANPALRNTYYRWNLLSQPVAVYEEDSVVIERHLASVSGLSRPMVKTLYQSVCTNNIACLSPERKVAGYGLYRHLSRCNHACDPSTAIMPGQEGTGALELVALRDIDAGESLTWSYIAVNSSLPGISSFADLDFETRNFALFNDYNFVCRCPLCDSQRPSDQSIAQLTAALRRQIQEQAAAVATDMIRRGGVAGMELPASLRRR